MAISLENLRIIITLIFYYLKITYVCAMIFVHRRIKRSRKWIYSVDYFANPIDYFDWTRCKARNILTGIALVKRAIKILSTLSAQSEAEDDFIAATCIWPWMAAKWVRSYHIGNGKISDRIFCSMFPMNMIYFIYRPCHRYWISFQLQTDKFEADLPLAKISWKFIIAGKRVFKLSIFNISDVARMSNTISVKVMSGRNYIFGTRLFIFAVESNPNWTAWKNTKFSEHSIYIYILCVF